MARLVRQTDGGSERHELLFRSMSIGRGLLNDVVIDDPGERRVHAEILALGRGRHVVRDKRSRGGVFVNGLRAEGLHALANGDRVRVGEAVFVFEAEPEDAAEAKPREDTMAGGVLKLTVGTLVSRVFGYVREVVALAYFGLSGLFDAYVAALTLPNLFRDVLGERVAESAFTPAHRTLVNKGRGGDARRLTASVLCFVAFAGLVLVVFGVVFAPWLVMAIVPGFAGEHPDLVATTTRLARWMMPYLAVIAVSAVFGSLLLSERRFMRYALAPVGSSVCVILSVVLLHRVLGVGALAVGLVAGGLAQMVISAMPYLRRREETLFVGGPLVDWHHAPLRKVARSAAPIAAAGLMSRLSSVVDRALASMVPGTGRIGALYAAQRLMQLPFGIFGLAVGRAAFPSLIEEASSHRTGGFSKAVVRALRYNMFLMLPATVAIMMLVRPFVRVMYERGEFTPAHTGLAAVALLWYAVGLSAMGARTVLTRAFYARLSTRTPFVLSAVQVGTNVVLSILLVRTRLEHGGLALATSIAFCLEAALLLVMLRREVAEHGGTLSLAGLWGGIAKIGACGGLMVLSMWWCTVALAGALASDGTWARVAQVAVPGLVGMAAYMLSAAVLGCQELRALRRGRLARKREDKDSR